MDFDQVKANTIDKLKRVHLAELPDIGKQKMANIQMISISNNTNNLLKICSFTVASLRSIAKKTNMKYFLEENANIYVLQELRCPIPKIPSIARLSGYNFYASESTTPGRNGVALLLKTKTLNVSYSIDHFELDTEGRFICAEFENFVVISVYTPYSGEQLQNLQKRLNWDKIFQKHGIYK